MLRPLVYKDQLVQQLISQYRFRENDLNMFDGVEFCNLSGISTVRKKYKIS